MVTAAAAAAAAFKSIHVFVFAVYLINCLRHICSRNMDFRIESETEEIPMNAILNSPNFYFYSLTASDFDKHQTMTKKMLEIKCIRLLINCRHIVQR